MRHLSHVHDVLRQVAVNTLHTANQTHGTGSCDPCRCIDMACWRSSSQNQALQLHCCFGLVAFKLFMCVCAQPSCGNHTVLHSKSSSCAGCSDLYRCAAVAAAHESGQFNRIAGSGLWHLSYSCASCGEASCSRNTALHSKSNTCTRSCDVSGCAATTFCCSSSQKQALQLHCCFEPLTFPAAGHESCWV